MSILEKAGIEVLIPHRDPFLLIDRVTELEPGVRAVAEHTFTGEEWYLKGHFPGNPIVPGVILVESCAQAATVMAMALPEYRDDPLREPGRKALRGWISRAGSREHPRRRSRRGTRDARIQEGRGRAHLPRATRALRDGDRACMRGARAVDAAVRCGYRNVGTFEFLVDARGEFYFIEVNSRIQVEHTVTEMTTGIDLVKEQIALASGQPLSFSEEQIWVSGHAIECRINAEDSEQNFAPSTGILTTWLQPGGPGIRIDTHCFQGYEVPPYYDSLLAKVIAWGRDRAEAVTRMQRALDEFTIVGVTTNIPAHKKILGSELFRSGQVTTHLIDTVGVDALSA